MVIHARGIAQKVSGLSAEKKWGRSTVAHVPTLVTGIFRWSDDSNTRTSSQSIFGNKYNRTLRKKLHRSISLGGLEPGNVPSTA